MSSRPFESNPWPTATPSPQRPISHKRSLKRRRITDGPTPASSKSERRQIVADQAEISQAMNQCQIYSGNDVISCYPTNNTVVAQSQWTSFIWNSRRPEITQFNEVDVYLFHGDSQTPILHFQSLPNPSDQAGRLNTQVNDSWWGTNGDSWDGQNTTYPFYWVLLPSRTTLDGNQIPQPTFSAVQTTYLDSIIAASSSAAIASSASIASASAASANATLSSASSSSSQGGNVQSPSSGSGFPRWAIAVIVVLGFLAIAACCILAFLIMRRMRRREQQNTNRSSMGSSSPMMGNVGGPSPASPLLAGALINRQPSSVVGVGVGPAQSTQDHDAASTISRTGSAGNEAPFSGADAAIMADAFRKMLRKPDFADRPVEEGESPNGPEPEEMIGRELAEEGRDIRSVSSERGVRVETLSDGGDTVQDRHRSVD